MKPPAGRWNFELHPFEEMYCYSCEKTGKVYELNFDVFEEHFLCENCLQILKTGMKILNVYNYKKGSISKQCYILQKWKYDKASLSVLEARIIKEYNLKYEHQDPDSFDFSWPLEIKE